MRARSFSAALSLVALAACGKTEDASLGETRASGPGDAGGNGSGVATGGAAGHANGGGTSKGGAGGKDGQAGFGNHTAGGAAGFGEGGSAQAGSGQAGLGQAGLGQGGLGQAGFGQSGSGQAGFGQAGFGEGGVGQGGVGQGGFGQGGVGQGGVGQGGVGQGGVGQAGVGQAGFGQAGFGQAGQAGFGQAGSGQAGGGQAGFAQAGSGQGAQAGFAQGGTGQAGSGQAGSGGFPTCQPGTGQCIGNTAKRCNATGTGYDLEACDGTLGIFCDPKTITCANPCSSMLVGTSNIGCEYFPTVTSNGALYYGFHFAVSVANATLADAHVKVARAGQAVASATVAPGGLQTITLPWVDDLRHDYSQATSAAEIDADLPSSLVPGGGYILESDAPVTVFQFNPLEYEIPTPPDGSCPDFHMTGKCNSFTNDASILLPANALGTEYIVASRATLAVEEGDTVSFPGLVAITARDDGTQVTVTSTAFVRGGPNVSPMGPGDSQMFTLNRGDVVQLLAAPAPNSVLTNCVPGDLGTTLCEVPKTYDLTGTVIHSTKPVVAIGGHDCSFVPYSKFACDHLEQSLFPTSTWGTTAVVTAPQSVLGSPANDGTPDPHVTRVISGANGNHVTIDPMPPGFAPPATLDKGDWFELPMTSSDLAIAASGPIEVVEYMVGGDIVDPADVQTPKSKGDPSMSLAVPIAQWRRSYTFLAPSSYQYDFVNVISQVGTPVKVDGVPLAGPPPSPIGASGYVVRRVAIAGGAHTIESTEPFGLVVYGYGTYTSYMYPGGLSLETL